MSAIVNVTTIRPSSRFVRFRICAWAVACVRFFSNFLLK